MPFYFYYWCFEQVNTSWEGRVRSNVYVIFISSLLVRLFRFSVFRVGFFSTYQFISDTTLFSVKISRQTYKTKTQFSRSDFDVINPHYFIKVITATNFNFMLWLKLEILQGGVNLLLHVCINMYMYVYYTINKVYTRRVNRLNRQNNGKWNINLKKYRGRFSTS